MRAMRAIEKYQINTNLIPNLPQIPFRKGVGQYEGVVMHATAVYNDTATGERSYETTHFEEAFVHTFTDETQILQVADFKYISWNAGQTANQRYLGNELCQTHDHSKFLLAYDRWVWLAAYQLYQRTLGVIDNVTLNSHMQVTEKWHESTHTDPIDYLAEHGKTWADVVQDVTKYFNQFLKEEIAGMTVEDANKLIEILKGIYNAGLSQDEVHRLANALRKASGQPLE
ncbi:peptidoglycan recognition protein family protein [Paenibacillus aestuarii]|uniref:N-acetylmuramoyl-L-alanine amidase family protein n=1 Tax=Paenibacillus aestuarii TaxID=516965 RepID=A0ABW0KCT6_9BACL|nr:N-acetylmuramoyl-L-alanine amidase [Paenibacillus aestuarii]